MSQKSWLRPSATPWHKQEAPVTPEADLAPSAPWPWA